MGRLILGGEAVPTGQVGTTHGTLPERYMYDRIQSENNRTQRFLSFQWC